MSLRASTFGTLSAGQARFTDRGCTLIANLSAIAAASCTDPVGVLLAQLPCMGDDLVGELVSTSRARLGRHQPTQPIAIHRAAAS